MGGWGYTGGGGGQEDVGGWRDIGGGGGRGMWVGGGIQEVVGVGGCGGVEGIKKVVGA